MPKLSVNQVELYYELHGQGKPLVLIAGYTCDSSHWQPVIAELARHFQILIFDNRSVGRSTRPKEYYTIEDMAYDTIALIHELELHRPHILGHSMGGAIAQVVARQLGHQIDKLVICNSFAKLKSVAELSLRFQLGLRQDGTVSVRRFLSGVLPWFFSNDFLSQPDQREAITTLMLSHPRPPSVQDCDRQLTALAHFDSTSWLPTIRAPSLIITGEEDLICLPADAKTIASLIPNATFFSFPHQAHMPMLEQPQAFCHLLFDFLLN